MILSKFKDIEAVVLDVDGVLTDASVLVNEAGEHLRTFNIRDGYAMQQAILSGIHIWVISKGNSIGVEKRLRSLGLTEVLIGVLDKKPLMLGLLEKYRVSAENVLYMGDDIPDLSCLQLVGLPTCPADAVEEVKSVVKYISPKNGGKGAVRDVLEKVLKLKGKWHTDDVEINM